MKRPGSAPTFFPTPRDFRAWLEQHHLSAGELIVGFHKKDSGRPSLTWPESVDEALCFGWIDGVRRRLNETSYTIRFTPRRRGSVWSAVNIGRMAVLTKEDRARPAGLAAFAKRTARKSVIYSYEQRHRAKLEPAHEKRFRADKQAWAFFGAQTPSYRQLATYWIVSARKPETRLVRLARLIRESARGRRIR
jgi:uncharacterized protein YdeI (YjbR/CyaY-like superfamily)